MSYSEEVLGGAGVDGAVLDLGLLGEVVGRLDGRLHALDGEERGQVGGVCSWPCPSVCACVREVGGVGGDDDQREEPPHTADDPTRHRPAAAAAAKRHRHRRHHVLFIYSTTVRT